MRLIEWVLITALIVLAAVAILGFVTGDVR